MMMRRLRLRRQRMAARLQRQAAANHVGKPLQRVAQAAAGLALQRERGGEEAVFLRPCCALPSRAAHPPASPRSPPGRKQAEFRLGWRRGLARYGADPLAQRNADAHRAHDHRQRVGELRIESVAPALLAPIEDETTGHHPGHRDDEQRPLSGEDGHQRGHRPCQPPGRCPARSTSAADNARRGLDRKPNRRAAAAIIRSSELGAASPAQRPITAERITRAYGAATSASRSRKRRRCFCSCMIALTPRAAPRPARRAAPTSNCSETRAHCSASSERGGPGAVEPEIATGADGSSAARD